ncbi:MAG: hypothetical protein GY929_24275 [Actinomycetia bacterium]|nr:hypothetical protein [Actinomycetes bacterium]
MLNHLWDWLTITPDTFEAWHDWSTRLYEDLRSGALPDEIRRELAECGLKSTHARAWLVSLVAIVERHLFSSINHRDARHNVRAVLKVGRRSGVQLPDNADFGIFGRPDDHHGWGNPISPAELHSWRARGI